MLFNQVEVFLYLDITKLISAEAVGIPLILDYLLSLKTTGLYISSLSRPGSNQCVPPAFI